MSAARLRAALGVALGAGLLVAASGRAGAAPCDPALGEGFTGPVELGLRPAHLGAPRAPCREDGVSARLGGDGTIDVPNFYGHLGGGLELGARITWARIEWSADVTAPALRFAQNASFKATELEVGPAALGALWATDVRLGGQPVALAPALRVILPASASLEGDRGGGELALHAGLRPQRALTVDVHAGALVWLIEDADGSTRAFRQAWLAAGLGWRLSRRWVLLGGAEAAAGYFEDGLDHVLARGGVRLRTRDLGAFELGLVVPVAGRERADAAAHLGWRLPLGW